MFSLVFLQKIFISLWLSLPIALLRFPISFAKAVVAGADDHKRRVVKIMDCRSSRMNSGLMQIPKSFHDQGNISQALALPNRLQPSSLNT